MKGRDDRQRGPEHEEAISDLFLLVSNPMRGGGGPCVSNSASAALAEVLDRLSLTASCYLAPVDGRVPDTGLADCIDRVCAFLVEHPFCQVTLRPVHSVQPDWAGTVGLLTFYSSLVEKVRPFQEEGFRNQIVSRVRIFPILWFERPSGIQVAGPALKFLQENFFLPTLYLLPVQVHEWEMIFGEKGTTGPFERVYVGTSGEINAKKALEDIFLSILFDRFISYNMIQRMRSLSLVPCFNTLYFSSDGLWKSCPKGASDGIPGSRACSDCLLSGLSAASVAFRMNGRNSEFGHLCERIGSWLFKAGNHEAALEAWRMGTEQSSGHEVSSEVLLKTALCHYEKGELEPAMDCLRSALARDPESAEIRYQMGLCEYAWKDYIESADRFEEALRLGLSGSLKTEAEYMKGLSHYHIEEYEETICALERALSAGKRSSPVFFYLGLAWLGKGNPERALSYLLEALSTGPSEEDLFHVLFYVAHAHKELGQYEDALEFLKRAESTGVARKEVMNLAGFCLFKLGRYDEAIERFRICLESDPRSAIDWANIGSCLRDKGDREGAIAMYRKALSLDPGIEFAKQSLERLLGEGSA